MCIDYSKSWIFVVLTKRKRSVAHVTYLAIPLLVVNKTSKQTNAPSAPSSSPFLLPPSYSTNTALGPLRHPPSVSTVFRASAKLIPLLCRVLIQGGRLYI